VKTAQAKTLSDWAVESVRGVFSSITEGWSGFWFRSPAPSQMKLLRVAAGSVIFLSTLARTFDLDFFYGDKGMMPRESMNVVANMHWRYSLFQIFPSMTAVWVCHIALLTVLALMIFGVYPRAMAFLTMVLHLSFIHRNVAIAYGVDTIATYYLFYLCFADYRAIDPVATPKLDWRRVSGSMFYRLCQIQVCLIYGFAGLDKVKGASWWRGDALWMIFANTQRATLDLSWLAHFPAVLAFMTYGTLFFEVYFPVVVWFKPVGRFIALASGVMMHCGIALTMGLVSFSSLMVSTYALFLDASLADKITQCVKKYATHRKVFLHRADQ
jgi:hypothetical protein